MTLTEAEQIIQAAKGNRFQVRPYTGERFRDVQTCDLFELRHTGFPFGRYVVIVAIDPRERRIVGQRAYWEGRGEGS